MSKELDDLKLSPLGKLIVSIAALLLGVVATIIPWLPENVDKTERRLILDYWWLWAALLVLAVAISLWVTYKYTE